MSSTCPTCGHPRSSAGTCGCAPADPFPLDEFAPEIAPAVARPGPVEQAQPAAPPADDEPRRGASVLEIARTRLSAASTPPAPASGAPATDALALSDPSALEPRTPPYRSRTRIPVGIRLVIGRRRKPARMSAPIAEVQPFAREVESRRAPVDPAPREPVQQEAPPAPTAPRRSHPALEAQSRLFDEPAVTTPPPSASPAALAPAPAPPAAPAPPVARPPAAPPAAGSPASTALSPMAPASPPAPRVERPLRAERLRVKPEDAPPPRERARRAPDGPPGPSAAARLVESLGRTLGSAAAAAASFATGPRVALAAGLLVLAGSAVLSPSLVAPLLGLAALLLSRREERAGEAPSSISIQLTSMSLAASAGMTALAFAHESGVLPGLERLLRPAPLALPAGLLSLVLAVAASLALARRFRASALAATGLPILAVALGQAVAPGASGLACSAGALGLAAAAGLRRSLRAEALREASLAWSAGAALAAIAAAVLSPWSAPAPLASSLALGALGGAAWSGVARLTRSYDEQDRRIARLVALAAGTCLALSLVILATALGSPLAHALALAPLAGLAHHLLLRFKDARHHSRLDAPWLATDGRILATLGALLALGAATGLLGLAVAAASPNLAAAWALGAAPSAGALALLLAAGAKIALADLELCRRAPGRLVAPLLGAAAACGAGIALGLPLAWIPMTGAMLLASLVVGTGVAARRHWRPAENLPWSLPLLVGSGACLVGALAACASGEWLAGGAGVVAASLAPWSLRAHPAAPATETPAAPAHASRSLSFAMLALAPAAPLVALGQFRWVGPLFAVEAIACWALSRRRAEALVPLAALLVASAALLPLLASRAGFVPGLVMLAGWTITAALEASFAAREPARGTRGLAAAVGVGAGLALVAWIAAALDVAAVTLLVAAVLLQAADRLAADAVIGRALRGAVAVAWLAGAGLGAVHAAADPLRAALLMAGAGFAALLIAALRGEHAPAFAAGLAGAAALASACLHVGIPPLRHPAVYLAPVAAFLVAWSVLETWRGARSRVALGAGLFVLAGSVLLESHLPSAPPLLRIVAAALAATIVAGGVVARQRTPVLAGCAALALELLWLLGEGLVLVARHPLPGLTTLVALLVVAATAVTHLAWRAGGRAPLLLAWTSDLARVREAWSRWSP